MGTYNEFRKNQIYMYRRRKRKYKILQRGNQTKYRMYLFRHKDQTGDNTTEIKHRIN